MSRREYRAEMRAVQDDDSSIFLVDWQFCVNDDVPGLPFDIAFGTSHFEPEPFDLGGIGEVRKVFYPGAETRLPGFLTGQHFCGSQDQWQNGWPNGTPGSPIIDGVPVCCGFDEAPFDFGFEYGFES